MKMLLAPRTSAWLQTIGEAKNIGDTISVAEPPK